MDHTNVHRAVQDWGTSARRRRIVVAYLQRNPSLVVGAILLLLLALIALGGQFFIGYRDAAPLSNPPSRPPGGDYLLGTDKFGRDLLAVLVYGTYLTGKVGLLAGALGVLTGAVLGFLAGFFRGRVDLVISLVTDVLLTVPPLLVLVVIATNIPGKLDTNQMAIIISLLAWRQPTRQIRAQALIMREAGYVKTARLGGTSKLGIVFKELMPNLIPYLMASFVLAVATAMLASVGLEALGLGPQNEPTLGMTIYWVMLEGAFTTGLWWWWSTPLIALITLFVGLYLVSAGLDELANPRTRRRGA
ncbi:ABC transporter permease [Bauldia sp.]|uniref:ABC transporter permease n=1 Tax=Bauldia sp. TaxID=2575872 RepID=UPI003BA8AC7E